MAISSQVLSPKTVNRTLLEEEILPHVFKPGRYIGLEQGAYRKPFGQAAATMAVVFPDLYEIGFSNYGLRLLYNIANQHPAYMCDRVYAPAPDFKTKLAEYDMPLYAVESLVPIKDFDLLAVSLQYELNYTTILGILEAARIPFRSAERNTLEYPLLIAGGPGSSNPMPLAPFIDAFILGDGEEVLIEILDVIQQAKKDGIDKPELMQRLGKVDGIFIPGVTEQAFKRIVDIAEKPVDMAALIPVIETVHDRVVIEARRGCDRMCRFCQPCFINLPVREQSIENIKKKALAEIEKTGYEECSLLSLSIADYSYFKPLVLEVADALKEYNVSLSLPSQRADRFSLDVAEAVQSVRKSTLTFAPEAGTMRLRDVINKNLSDKEIMNAVTSAYQAGWNKVKLYFMIGLPTETHEDLDGILDIVRRMQAACAQIKRESSLSIKKSLEINLTISNFVPKPHTPFQWFPQDSMEMLNHKIAYIREKARGIKGLKINFTDPEISKLEAVISKGGQELADVVESAYRKGAYLDAWDDADNFQKWFEALSEVGIECEAYTRERCVDPDEPLPWDAVNMGLTKSWLVMEYERAKTAASTTPCFDECSTCGVCASYGTWPKFTELPKTPKKENNAIPPVIQSKKDAVCKVRVRLEKRGKLRFISHLDWLRLIHKAVTRGGWPVAYTQGFNPKLKISFGPALPLFSESLGEYVDIELTEKPNGSLQTLLDVFNQHLPEDGKAFDAYIIPIGTPSIDKSIQTLTYTATPAASTAMGANYSGQTTCITPVKEYTITERVHDLVRQEALPVEVETKRTRSQTTKKVLDIAPYLDNLHVDEHGAVNFTIKRHQSKPGDSGEIINIKPGWVLKLINPDLNWSMVRTKIELA